MSTEVYTTHGRKYHADAACPLMVGGEMLWDAGYAAACGKLPCLRCIPAALRVFPPLYGQTFGHEPVFIMGDHFCARCRTRDHDEYGDPRSYPTLWPCTSAVVLGLASRTEGSG